MTPYNLPSGLQPIPFHPTDAVQPIELIVLPNYCICGLLCLHLLTIDHFSFMDGLSKMHSCQIIESNIWFFIVFLTERKPIFCYLADSTCDSKLLIKPLSCIEHMCRTDKEVSDNLLK